jgi:multidrug efflux system outer membrane protein
MKTNWKKLIVIIVAGIILTGCVTVGPDYSKPKIETGESWNQKDSGLIQSKDLEASRDISHWWTQLNDPLLTALIIDALETSPDIKSAQLKLKEARARRAMVYGEFFPDLSASAGVTNTQSGAGSSSNLYSAGFDASWELDIFGKVERSMEASSADMEVAQADLKDVQVTLASEVAVNYIEIRSLQSRLSLVEKNLESQQETFKLSEWKEKAGLVHEQDVEQSKSTVEQTRAQIPAIQANLSEAEHRLEVLLGVTPGTLHEKLSVRVDLPVVPDQITIEIPSATLRNRPDIRKAERTLAAETARVGVAEAERYPSLSLTGSIGREALSSSGLGSSATSSSLLGSISGPIFNAGILKSQVQVQESIRDQAQVAYEQSILTALQEVEDALTRLVKTRESALALKNAVEASQKASVLAKQRYEAGLIDFQSVLSVEQTFISIEEDYTTSQADYITSLISLYKAFGGGWTTGNANNKKSEG